MIGFFTDYIRNAALFMIFMSIVGIVLPGERYKPFVKLVMGFVLVFILVEPIMGLLSGGLPSMAAAVAELNLSADQKKLALQIEEQSGEQQAVLIAEYKERLTDGLSQLIANGGEFGLYSCEMEISEEDGSFGVIRAMDIVLGEEAAAETPRPIIRVEPIKPGSMGVFADNESDPDDPRMVALKNTVGSFYNLSTANIHISVRN